MNKTKFAVVFLGMSFAAATQSFAVTLESTQISTPNSVFEDLKPNEQVYGLPICWSC